MLQIGLAQGWGTDLEQIKQHMLKGMMSNPTGRLGTVDDVANLVTFVSSPLAGYILLATLTGQTCVWMAVGYQLSTRSRRT